MTDRVFIPLPDGRWLALGRDQFDEALAAGAVEVGVRAAPEPTSRAQQAPDVTAVELARALGVKATWVLRKARRREIPFTKAGKYCRFCIEDVRKALAKGVSK